MDDLLVEGKVISRITGQAIQDIMVSVEENGQFVHTNGVGEFAFYTERREQMTLQFKDVDAEANGTFTSRDTVLKDLSDRVYVEIALENE